jgi:hypothetical protein
MSSLFNPLFCFVPPGKSGYPACCVACRNDIAGPGTVRVSSSAGYFHVDCVPPKSCERAIECDYKDTNIEFLNETQVMLVKECFREVVANEAVQQFKIGESVLVKSGKGDKKYAATIVDFNLKLGKRPYQVTYDKTGLSEQVLPSKICRPNQPIGPPQTASPLSSSPTQADLMFGDAVEELAPIPPAIATPQPFASLLNAAATTTTTTSSTSTSKSTVADDSKSNRSSYENYAPPVTAIKNPFLSAVISNQNSIFLTMQNNPHVTLPRDGLTVMLQAQKVAMEKDAALESNA